MVQEKRSFLERLTGSVHADDYNDDIFDERPLKNREVANEENNWLEEESTEGQLTVDVFQNTEQIIIKALVAGVRPDQLDVSITRDMVTIRGKREESKEVTEDNYFYKELYWGSFSRTILLPQEIDVEASEATVKHGLLSIRLPKIDKERQTKLKVRGG